MTYPQNPPKSSMSRCSRWSSRLATLAYPALVVVGISTASSIGQAAFRFESGDAKLQFGGLVQPTAAVTTKSAPMSEEASTEFYLRRIRFTLSGQLNNRFRFYLNTDGPNFGKNGSYDVNMFMQDGYLEFMACKELQVDAGMFQVPFSHQTLQGSGSLLGLDAHSDLMRYPIGSHKGQRDAGVQVRGLLFGKWLEYRLGLFNGVFGKQAPLNQGMAPNTWTEATDPRNPSDAMRVAGRLEVNLLEPEAGPLGYGASGFLYRGINIEKKDGKIVTNKSVLSIGGSFDWQRHLNIALQPTPTGSGGTRGAASRSDYLGLSADIFLDVPVNSPKTMSVTAQANGYYYDFGDRSDPNAFYNRADQLSAAKFLYTGVGIASEAGFRYNCIEPVVIFDYYKPTESKTTKSKENASALAGDYMGIYGGLNFWLNAHTTNIKLQVGSLKQNGGEAKVSGLMQAQLVF